MQLLNTSTAVTREFLLLYTYLLPTITLCAVFGINYLLGALAVNRLCKRYLPGKAEKLCFLPFVRYYYVGKLAFSGKFNSKSLSWVGIVFPIFEGLRVIGSLAMEILRTVFAYASTVDILALYEKDQAFWSEDLNRMILPSAITPITIVMDCLFAVGLVFGAMLFINFFRRFKTRNGVFFGLLSLLLFDGIFLFVCRNNRTIEEEVEAVKAAYNRGVPPYGNPYGNPYGQNFQNPYGAPNPYANPYANQSGQANANPYATPNQPYGENGTSFGAPTHPNSAPQNDNPFADLEGDSGAPQNDSPFGEFDNPENKN